LLNYKSCPAAVVI